MKRNPIRSPLKLARDRFHHPESFLTRLGKPGFSWPERNQFVRVCLCLACATSLMNVSSRNLAT